MSKEYCVYQHKIDGDVFYVGCGDMVRPYNLSARTMKWKKITEGKKVNVCIVKEFKYREDAEKYEIEMIIDLQPAGNSHHVSDVNFINTAHAESDSVTDIFIAGLRNAAMITGITKRQACLSAGVNETTLRRFMHRQTDIKLVNLSAICQVGYKMSLSKVIALGGGE